MIWFKIDFYRNKSTKNWTKGYVFFYPDYNTRESDRRYVIDRVINVREKDDSCHARM